MRVPDIYERRLVSPAPGGESDGAGILFRRDARQQSGDLSRGKAGRTHIYPGSGAYASRCDEVELFYAAQSLDRYAGAFYVPVVVKIFSDAADTVSAHASFRSVVVEHPHLRVGDAGGADHDQAVSSYAEMAVGYPHRKLRGIGDAFPHAVGVYVIVADAVHFYKSHYLLLLRARTAAGSSALPVADT